MPVDNNLTVLSRLLDVSVERQKVHQANLANQNVPGYKARELRFEEAFSAAMDDGGVEAALRVDTEVVEANATAVQPDGNDVVSEREIQAMARNQLQYNAYLGLTKGKLRLYTTAISAAPG
jgi:flagellar basal-body rod protein FlgB